MEQLDFTFKKNRKLGELLSDFISLFKMIFKHYNSNILAVSLPFIAVAFLLGFYAIGYFINAFNGITDGFSGIITFLSVVFPAITLFTLFFIVISVFGIEYMFLLEKKGNTNFTTRDILSQAKKNLDKYIKFTLFSILVGIVVSIPVGLVAMVLTFIPIIGTIAIGIMGAMVSLFFYCALFLYLQNRKSLTESYGASFNLIKPKIFEYGVATYLFQLITQIILGLTTIIPMLILGIVAYAVVGFNQEFFVSFGGKFIMSLVGMIAIFFAIFAAVYMVSFAVLEYFSLLEVSYSEETIDNIDEIGTTRDEFH